MPRLPPDMPPSLQREVRELVDAALALEPAARADFIRRASRGNESLSDEALRVLGEISHTIERTVGTGPSGPGCSTFLRRDAIRYDLSARHDADRVGIEHQRRLTVDNPAAASA